MYPYLLHFYWIVFHYVNIQIVCSDSNFDSFLFELFWIKLLQHTNICEYISVSFPLGIYPRTTRPQDRYISNFTRNCHFLQSDYKILFPWAMFENSSYSPILTIFILAILTGGKRYFNVVFICISLMANAVKQLFTCLLTVYLLLWTVHWNFLFILIRLFEKLICWSSVYILWPSQVAQW